MYSGWRGLPASDLSSLVNTRDESIEVFVFHGNSSLTKRLRILSC